MGNKIDKKDYDKRIENYYNALSWFAESSTADIAKLSFNVAIDTVAVKQRENFQRWLTINADINEIWQNGTDKQRARINEIIESVDKKYKK